MNVVSRPGQGSVLGCQCEPPYLLSSKVKLHIPTISRLLIRSKPRNIFLLAYDGSFLPQDNTQVPQNASGSLKSHLICLKPKISGLDAKTRPPWQSPPVASHDIQLMPEVNAREERELDTRDEGKFLLFSRAQRPVCHRDIINTYSVFVSGFWPEFLKPWGFLK